MRSLRILLLSLVFLAAAPPSFTPYLVKDIDTEPAPASSNPTGFFAFRNLALFQVLDESFGSDHRGLWRSDGTASGTYRLVRGQDFAILGTAGGRCFFTFQADDHRGFLGVTDGTLPGTYSLLDRAERPVGSSAAVKGVFYFALGEELWRSDGTPGGTQEVVADLSGPYALTSYQGSLYFAATSGLWASDGTAAGTRQVFGIRVSSMQAVGTRLVFAGTDAQGAGLWAGDGTAAGTRRIAGLVQEDGQPSFSPLKIAGQRLFFTAKARAGQGEDLYVTDGTSPGTRRLTWFSDLTISGGGAVAGGRLLFWVRDAAYDIELWTSDGTPKGTRRLLDSCSYFCWANSFLYPHRGRVYFLREESQLWVTDGTSPGTHLAVDDLYDAEILGSAGDRMFLASHNGWWTDTMLWVSDGTANGTVQLAEFYGENFSIEGASVGGVLFFPGDDGTAGIEPWRSDGTVAGTRMLLDVADEDLGGSDPHDLMALGQNVLFFVADGHYYTQLWRSDGTEAGTQLVTTGLGGLEFDAWSASATRVFFVPNRHRQALWTSDGTKAGTVRLTPAGVRCKGEISAPVIKLGSRVFFSAWSPTAGDEPWITDGTPAGTRMVADLVPGAGNSYPRGLTVFAGRAWFSAASRLWKSDGTAKGTVAVGPELRSIGSLTVHAGRLWFLNEGRELWSTDGSGAGLRKIDLPAPSFKSILSDGVRLYLSDEHSALWVSDGTAAGTRRISDQGLDVYGGIWTAFAGRIYYRAPEGAFYTSDGTPAGTRPVRPDGEPRYARKMLGFGGRLVIKSGEGELWESDGTAAGTRQVPGSPPTWRGMVKAGPRLFFEGWEEATGWELWAMGE
ncbi:MAG: hypothetical protein ACJ75H_23445 [Thermoanaerobaculia bacterium]